MIQHLPGLEGLERHVARTMRVLTLWDPWGTLVAAGFKRHETRHWATSYRGLVAIHVAARRPAVEDGPAELCEFAFGKGWTRNRPLGCVVAIASLTGCHRTDWLTAEAAMADAPADALTESDYLSGNYEAGRFAFRLENVRPLRSPLPLKSRQTPLWEWHPPADLESRLLPLVDHFAAARRWEARHAA